MLSDKLDWSTLLPLDSSHAYNVVVTNGKYVAFAFDNINLPAQQDNEEGSNGFIAFKIKPKQDVIVNDVVLGKADIFFDYNPPITTNTVTTKFTPQLSVQDAVQTIVRVHPIPSKALIHISASKTIRISNAKVFSLNGALLIHKKHDFHFIDISNLSKGVYFLKLESDNGEFMKKIVKD